MGRHGLRRLQGRLPRVDQRRPVEGQGARAAAAAVLGRGAAQTGGRALRERRGSGVHARSVHPCGTSPLQPTPSPLTSAAPPRPHPPPPPTPTPHPASCAPQEPTTFFHEISHNLYCNHAGKWGNKGYEDLSGAMGYCCDIRCHNAVHSYQVRAAARAPLGTAS